MKILRPQNTFFDKLIETEDLLDEIKENDEINNCAIENIILEDYKIYDLGFDHVKFLNTEITNSRLDKNTFIDTIFENCNFSNTSFEGCNFIRCEFDKCKMTGCNFSESRFHNVSLLESNANYINLSMANLDNVIFKNTGLRNSSFHENKLKDVYFQKADLTRSQVFKTSFKNIDLSDSIIEGISISIEDIRGAIIEQFQAVDLLYLIGVKIKQ